MEKSGWKIEDEGERKVLVKHIKNGKTSIPLPITIIRKVIKRTKNSFALIGYKKKKPDFLFTFLRWYSISEDEDGSLALVNALDGKKIKITIEVLE